MADEDVARKRVILHDAYVNIFEKSPDGRLVLLDLMEKCGFLVAYEGGSIDDLAFREGKRAIVVQILEELRFDPAKLLDIAMGRLDENAGQE